ncbi:rod shape-determining protein MreC [Falsibacillus pallidus]|uniref:Cell shape-determining protein MreC n=1 Tax=Falsibacillus pallidus TaxID=493781 RepID=A0A370GK46_9BACI|nr:rod shape-determining protein MreC [Falsibacillus pallidus]RDI44148.1 rod shape-determining protein MreC [Falsibacillus pallidus]
MPQFFLNKRLILLLVSIIVLVALIGFSLRDRENVSLPEQFISDIVGFGQNLVSKPAGAVAGFIQNVEDLQNTYIENKKLKARLDELASLDAKVNDLQKDNKDLRETLNIKDNLRDYNPTQATVIARNPVQWEELLQIDKGLSSGVKPNMAVITAKGFIGKIKSSKQFTSTVQLLSSNDPKNRISVKVQGEKGEKNVFGLIEGYDAKKKMLILKRLPYDVDIKKGRNVVTSGMGGLFTEGIPIGKIEKLVPDQYGLTQMAYVKPSADLYDVEHVMVIDRTIAKSDAFDLTTEKEGE